LTYTVVATAGSGCTNSGTSVITVNPLPTITLTSPATVSICNGGNTDIVVALTGTAPWVWTGNDGSGIGTFTATSSPYTSNVNPTVNTTYTIIDVTDANGCTNTSTESVVVTVNTPAAVTITENAGTLTSDATTGNQWYGPSGLLSGETAQTFTPTVNGDYYVIVTDGNGCTSTSNVISFVLSVSQNLNTNGIKVYPNPTHDRVWIEVLNSNNTSIKVEIMSMDSRVLFENETTKLGLTKMNIDLNEFAPGVYVVKATSGEKTIIQKLVVK
jgi:hypothetical protein